MRRDPYRSMGYIVSEEHAFVYCSIPKVACSSIKTALLPLFSEIDPGDGFEREVRDGTFAYRVHGLFTDSGYTVKRGRFLRKLERGRYDRYFKFAFVRNPWDRLLSCWKQKLAPGGQGLGQTEYAGEHLHIGMGFPEFARAVCRIPDEEANRHFRSQYIKLCKDGPGKRVLADFVGRHENLAEDFALAAGKIGADPELPHLLPTRGSASYRDLYDRELAAMVGERYSLDAEIFGYRF